MSNLTGHQIDVLRRQVNFLIEQDGEAKVAKVASRIASLHENGLTPSEWAGYGKFERMIDDYPQFFEIYPNDSNVKCVRPILSNSRPLMDFDDFVYNNLTPELALKTCSEHNLKGLDDYCVFSNYIRYTRHKATAEGKVLSSGKVEFFHTGLFNSNNDSIYCVWGYTDNTPFIFFILRSSHDGKGFMRTFGNQTPQMVCYETSTFDPNLHIEPEFGHILDERYHRFPQDLLQFLRQSSLIAGDSEALTDAEVIGRCKNFLRLLLMGSIQDTISNLKNHIDEAVPFWNKKTDKICWLIPLRLGVDYEPDLALVLEPSIINGEDAYHAHTVLTLKDAYKCARLLGCVKAEWLSPDKILNTSYPQ